MEMGVKASRIKKKKICPEERRSERRRNYSESSQAGETTGSALNKRVREAISSHEKKKRVVAQQVTWGSRNW